MSYKKAIADTIVSAIAFAALVLKVKFDTSK